MSAANKRFRSGTAPLPSKPQATEPTSAIVAFATDADGHVQSWSREAQALFGYHADEIVGRSRDVLVAPVDPPGGEGAGHQSGSVAPFARFVRKDRTVFAARYTPVELRSAAGITTHAAILTSIENNVAGVADDRDANAVALPPRPSAELRWSEEARVRLLRRLVIAQEEERRRIARDLHDHLGQQLTSLRLKVEAVRSGTSDRPDVQATLAQADALLTQIDSDIDFLSWELRPAALDDLGLEAVLTNYVSEWSRHASVPARFHAEGLGHERVAPEIEATLYRIAQEALTNVARHAQARAVAVVLARRGGFLALAVEDDGVGFDSSTITNTMIGLVGMRERAAVVGGTLEVEPTPGGGTTVLARVPMSVSAHERPDGGDGSESRLALTSESPLGEASADASERTAQLQRAVAARDEFIATVAHELRNPIAPLMFQVRLSIDKTEQLDRAGQSISAEWVRGQLGRIEQRLHRLLETLDRLLDVSRLSIGRIDLVFESVDLADVARDVVGSFDAELAVARCEVRLTAPAVVVGWWDRLRLDQICRNLISNAIRFGAGSPIDVTVDADASEATLRVRDYGIGIPPHKQDAIFERFERGPESSRSGGFGIGLWVVRNLCTAMGGEITVDSAVGLGSTFAVTLPRRPEREQRREESA